MLLICTLLIVKFSFSQSNFAFQKLSLNVLFENTLENKDSTNGLKEAFKGELLASEGETIGSTVETVSTLQSQNVPKEIEQEKEHEKEAEKEVKKEVEKAVEEDDDDDDDDVVYTGKIIIIPKKQK